MLVLATFILVSAAGKKINKTIRTTETTETAKTARVDEDDEYLRINLK